MSCSIRLRVLDAGTHVVMCRVDPSTSLVAVLAVMARRILPALVGPDSFVVNTLLSKYSMCYRGRVITKQDAMHSADVAFGIAYPTKDGEEIILKKRRAGTPAAHSTEATVVVPYDAKQLFNLSTPERSAQGSGLSLDAMKTDPSSTSGTWTLSSIVNTRSHRRIHDALRDFLILIDEPTNHRWDIASWFGPSAARSGILSLGSLCCQSSRSLADVIRVAAPPHVFLQDINHAAVPFAVEIFAHRMITLAHRTMRSKGYVIDWPHRLSEYLRLVDPGRGSWSGVSSDEDAWERAWHDLREQYEEHVVKAARDLESRGAMMYPSYELPLTGADDLDANAFSGTKHVAADSAPAVGFLVMCPECNHTFQHTPPSLTWQWDELRRAIQRAEMTSMSLQKEKAMREVELGNAIKQQSEAAHTLRAERDALLSTLELQRERVTQLESENQQLRDRLRHSHPFNSRAAIVTRTSLPFDEATSSPHPTLPFTLKESLVESQSSTLMVSAQSPPNAAVSTEERRRIRRILVGYLERHNPDAITMADVIMHAWKEREYELERVLRLPPSRAPLSLSQWIAAIE